jgi:hypothetical protein
VQGCSLPGYCRFVYLLTTDYYLLRQFFPKITQSPWAVAMNKRSGSDNQAFVREAMNA